MTMTMIYLICERSACTSQCTTSLVTYDVLSHATIHRKKIAVMATQFPGGHEYATMYLEVN